MSNSGRERGTAIPRDARSANGSANVQTPSASPYRLPHEVSAWYTATVSLKPLLVTCTTPPPRQGSTSRRGAGSHRRQPRKAPSQGCRVVPWLLNGGDAYAFSAYQSATLASRRTRPKRTPRVMRPARPTCGWVPRSPMPSIARKARGPRYGSVGVVEGGATARGEGRGGEA